MDFEQFKSPQNVIYCKQQALSRVISMKGYQKMPNFTKRAIKDAFLRQLNERPLSQITVKDIVEECGINRNSFYYHYAGLPALLEEIVTEELERLIHDHPTISSMEQAVDAAVEFIRANKRAVLHIYNSMSRDIFEKYLMDTCRYVVSTYLNTDQASRSINEADRAILIRYHTCACFGNIIDWLNGGMKDDLSAYFRRIFQMKIVRNWEEGFCV